MTSFPALAVAQAPARVRETRRARATTTPVILERDRRDPRRHGVATAPAPTSGATEAGTQDAAA